MKLFTETNLGVVEMNAQMQTRNIVIARRRTTVRLETAVWNALDEICLKEDISRHELCTMIDEARGLANRAQAVCAAVINYFRLPKGHSSPKGQLIVRALQGVE